MKKALAVILCGWIAFPTTLSAGEKVYRVDGPGYLVKADRYSIADFSTCRLVVTETDGVGELPCRFVYQPEAGGSRCEQIELSSVLTESGRRHDRDSPDTAPVPHDFFASADGSCPMPEHLQIGILGLELEGSPIHAVLATKDAGLDTRGRPDSLLYRKIPERFFRYTRSSETNACFWNIRLVGKRIDYRICPIDFSGDDLDMEVADVRSPYFTRMALKYRRKGGDFRLRGITLTGNHVYRGGLWERSDPAALEVRRICVNSNSTISLGEDDACRIVETGRGVLKSRATVQYKMFRQTANEPFKVELAVCDGGTTRLDSQSATEITSE
ncbi:MAG: hypothetical protein ACI4RA_07795 [Kiritimatiellia bacterium]